jgi:hypothetical protein
MNRKAEDFAETSVSLLCATGLHLPQYGNLQRHRLEKSQCHYFETRYRIWKIMTSHLREITSTGINARTPE